MFPHRSTVEQQLDVDDEKGDMTHVSDTRALYSELRIAELSSALSELPELRNTSRLTMFAAGSYARLEASQYSDIDLFFLSAAATGDADHQSYVAEGMFEKIREVARELEFPEFSNGGEYLEVLGAEEILVNLGNRTDDHRNFFTARMLMLLESRCLFGRDVFDSILKTIVGSYFKDYPGHKDNFQPTFLINDISRYWKTILLNYENKRPLAALAGEVDLELRKTKNRVRNFKLKFSRLTTCFATVAAIGSFAKAVTEDDVIDMVQLTPRDRLMMTRSRLESSAPIIDEIINQYDWFLHLTGLPSIDLEREFSDSNKRTTMFARANEYGDLMFSLLVKIDQEVPRSRLLRTLSI